SPCHPFSCFIFNTPLQRYATAADTQTTVACRTLHTDVMIRRHSTAIAFHLARRRMKRQQPRDCNTRRSPAMSSDAHLSRRAFLRDTALASGSLLTAGTALAQDRAPAVIRRNRPALPYGVASGDIMADRGIIWSRCDRPARLFVDYALRPDFKNARRITGPAATAGSDYTARLDLRDLPAGQTIYYRVSFQDLRDLKAFSEPVNGRFRTVPADPSDIVFQWSG